MDQMEAIAVVVQSMTGYNDLNTENKPRKQHFGYLLNIFLSPSIYPSLQRTHSHHCFLLVIWGEVLNSLGWQLFLPSNTTHIRCTPITVRKLSNQFLAAFYRQPDKVIDWHCSDMISVHMPAERKLDIESQAVHANCLKPEWLIWARERTRLSLIFNIMM